MDVTKHFWVRESEESRDRALSESDNGLAASETKQPQLFSAWQSRLGSLRQLRQTKDPLTWTSTWKRLGPLAGIVCLLIAIFGTAVSFIILWTSNGAPTSEWTVSPSTYLAIVTAIVNQVLGYAAFQGAVIAWWMRAMNGSTLGMLHQDWHSGTSLFGALSAGRSINLLAVACILSSLVAVDGPLLQRATRVESRHFNKPTNLHINLAPEIPHGLSGSYQGGPYNGSGTIMHGKSLQYTFGETNVFTPTALEWASKAPIRASTRGCKGTCKARVQAPAIAKTACTIQQYPFIPSKSAVRADALKSLDSITFYTDFEILPHDDHESINFTVAYRTSSAETCDLGHVTYTNCQLRSAVGLYDIEIVEDEIRIPSPGTVEILRLANNTAARPEDNLGADAKMSTLAGINFQAHTVFYSLAHGYEDGGIFQNLGYTGFVQQFTLPLTKEETRTVFSANTPCNQYRYTMLSYRFSDPTEYMLARLNELMFRYGIAATEAPINTFHGDFFDKTISSNQTLSGEEHGQETVSVTSYAWFAAGALADLLCVLCIFPTYWGWWRLGRSVSFSPLEMANAFEAPLFRDAGCPSNASGRYIATLMREKEVRYGATGNAKYGREGHVAEQVAFASSEVVYRLVNGHTFES